MLSPSENEGEEPAKEPDMEFDPNALGGGGGDARAGSGGDGGL